MCYELKKYTDNHYVLYQIKFIFKKKVRHGTKSECAAYIKNTLKGERVKNVNFN